MRLGRTLARLGLTLGLTAVPACAETSAAPSAPLPAYALGQPLADARQVVPNGQTRETWLLRCSGDPDAPAELALSAADRAAGRLLCWPMRRTSTGTQRAPSPPRLHEGIEELELRHGRIVRITRAWRTAGGVWGHETIQDGAR